MSPRLVILPEAKEDLREARRWYERKQKGLGNKFLSTVNDTLADIRRLPKGGLEVSPGVRRRLLRKYPYAIYYWPSDDRIVVLVVIHTSRDPRIWRNRIDEFLSEL